MAVRVSHILSILTALVIAHTCGAASISLDDSVVHAAHGRIRATGPSIAARSFEDATVHSLLMAMGGSIGAIPGSTHTSGAVDYCRGVANTISLQLGVRNAEQRGLTGLIWSDDRPNDLVTARAWSADGRLLGRIRTRLGNAAYRHTAETRFFGIIKNDGTARASLSSNRHETEVDHVQLAQGVHVVPVPSAFGLGAAGLLGAVICRKRLIRSLGK